MSNYVRGTLAGMPITSLGGVYGGSFEKIEDYMAYVRTGGG